MSREVGRGTSSALATSPALIVGFAIGAVVVLGGVGMRRTGDRVRRWVTRALAAVLAYLGGWLLLQEVVSG